MTRHLVLGVLTTVLLCNPSLGEDDFTSSLVIGGSCLASYNSTTCAVINGDDRRREDGGEDGSFAVPEYIGCGCVNFGTASKKLECTSTDQSLLSYSGVDCTGTPTSTISLDVSEGCIDALGSTIEYTCNYTGFDDDDEGAEDDDDGETCFSLSDQTCDDTDDPEVEPSRRRRVVGSGDVFIEGCGCVDDGQNSYRVSCDDEIPIFETWDNYDCLGESNFSLSLESYCVPFGDTNLTVQANCRSLNDDDDENDDCPPDDDDCLNGDDDDGDRDTCFNIYAGNRTTPELPIKHGCGCVEQDEPASGSQIIECFEGAVDLVTYSGENCTGTRTAQLLSEGLGGATQACTSYGEEGSICFFCNIRSNDDDDDDENNDCPEDDDDCVNDDDDEEGGQCFSIIPVGCDEPQRRNFLGGVAGCGCVRNTSTSSYRLTCGDGTEILSYDNGNCSGSPIAFQTLESDDACVPFNGMSLVYNCNDDGGDDDENDDCPPDDDDCLNGDDDEEGENDDEEEEEDDAAEALSLDKGPIGCAARHSASGCQASSEEASSCSCLNVPGSGSGRVRCDGDEAHLIIFDEANCQGSPSGARTFDDGQTCGQMDDGLFINVDCSNPKADPHDNNKDNEDDEESTGCMTLHLTDGCSGPEAGTACDCLKAPTGFPTFSAQLKCLGKEPQGVDVYDNTDCSSTPKETRDVDVDTCVSISQFNISVRVDCDNAASGLTVAASVLMAVLVSLVVNLI